MTRSVLAGSEYRAITLHEVPVCSRCENARYYWFGAAILAAVVGLMTGQVAGTDGALSHFVIGMFILGVILATIGTTKSPIRILKFDEASNSLQVKIYNRAVADEMVQREQRRTDWEGHAEYLAEQAERQRMRDREVRRTIRAICGVGVAGGLYFVCALGAKAGYAMIVFSLLCWAPFEWKYAHRRK